MRKAPGEATRGSGQEKSGRAAGETNEARPYHVRMPSGVHTEPGEVRQSRGQRKRKASACIVSVSRDGTRGVSLYRRQQRSEAKWRPSVRADGGEAIV